MTTWGSKTGERKAAGYGTLNPAGRSFVKRAYGSNAAEFDRMYATLEADIPKVVSKRYKDKICRDVLTTPFQAGGEVSEASGVSEGFYPLSED